MTEYDLEPKVFMVPRDLGDLLEPDNREPIDEQRVDARAIVDAGLAGTAVGAALEAMVQAGMVIGRTDRDQNEADIDTAVIEAAAPLGPEPTSEDTRTLELKANASVRRAYAAAALKLADQQYEGKFMRQRAFTNRETLGRAITERDPSAIGDLYDDTVDFDEHPAITAIGLARAAVRGEYEQEVVNQADVLLRMLFRGDTLTEPEETETDGSPPETNGDGNRRTNGAAA